jgi:hypothetical protein
MFARPSLLRSLICSDTRGVKTTTCRPSTMNRPAAMIRRIRQEYLKKILGKHLLMPYTQVDAAADITLQRSEDFVDAIERIAARVRPQVLENFRVAYRRQEEEYSREWTAETETAPLWRTIDTQLMAAWQVNVIRRLGDTLVERLLREPERSGNTYLFFSRLLLEELRPVTAQYMPSI